MTFLGVAVIDLLWWDRRQHFGLVRDLKYECYENMDEEYFDGFDVGTMANLIGVSLSDDHLGYWLTNQPSA